MRCKDTLTAIFDWPIRLSGFIAIIWSILSYYDIMPFYQVKLIKINSITPITYFLPGTQLRLGFESHDNSSNNEIATVKWTLTKGHNSYEVEGLEPTITIPPTESGLYVLNVAVTMLNGTTKHGQSNLYIVQDKPVMVKLNKPLRLNLSITDKKNTPTFSDHFHENDIEVYSGNGEWTLAKNASNNRKSINFELMPNDSFTTFDNKIIVRTYGKSKELNNYDSIQIPNELMESKP